MLWQVTIEIITPTGPEATTFVNLTQEQARAFPARIKDWESVIRLVIESAPAPAEKGETE